MHKRVGTYECFGTVFWDSKSPTALTPNLYHYQKYLDKYGEHGCVASDKHIPQSPAMHR